jgi:transcriptional regulator with XRE-family HTH domain
MEDSSWPALVLREARTRAGLSQRDLAARAGTTQSVVGRLEAGIASPNVDTLERLLAAAGFRVHTELRPLAAEDPVIEAYKRDIDRTLLRENLGKTPEARVRALQALSRLADEARAAGHALQPRRHR